MRKDMDKIYSIRLGLYHLGYTDEKIAEITNNKSLTISEWRRIFKLPKLYEKEDKRINNSLLYGLWNLGFSDLEISKLINNSNIDINSWRKQRNLKSNIKITSKIENRCKYCDECILTIPSNDKQFCNLDCYKKWIKENPINITIKNPYSGKRREESSSWIEDRTMLKKPINYNIRRSTDYKDWRNSVFERDIWTCQICHERGGILRAHHIRSFAKFPNERFNVDNGITLCNECHKWVHSMNPLNQQ